MRLAWHMSNGLHLAGQVCVVLACACACAGACAGAELSFSADDAADAFAAAADFVRDCTPRDGGTPEGLRAAEWLRTRVARIAPGVVLDRFTASTPRGPKTFANVVLEFPSARTNAPWIVVMSHFDTAPTAGRPFMGANDGASTSGLLVALAHAVRRAGPQPYGIQLVWTDGEECLVKYGPQDGFQGSRHLVDVFRRKGRAVKTALCLDMLGDRDLHVMVPANSTAELKRIARHAARKAGLADILTVDESINVGDDHAAFFEAGCPAIDFIDFSYGPDNAWWHTPQDTLDKISRASLEKAGRLTVCFLNVLLASPCGVD